MKGGLSVIRGVVQDGAILPLDPVPADWDGQQVTIETTLEATRDERAEIEKWYAQLEALGPAQYEPGERDAVERVMSIHRAAGRALRS